jgi:hypothetical protein
VVEFLPPHFWTGFICLIRAITLRMANEMTINKPDNPGSDRPIDARRVAIMQPYFVPYLGYFQLIAAAGTFVVYDDVHYIQRGWINRNRVLNQGNVHYVTIPLMKASQNKRICELSIAQTGQWQKKTLHTLRSAYGRAPHFSEVFPICEAIVACPAVGLVDFLEHSLSRLCSVLGIATRFVKSSELALQAPHLAATDQLRGATRIAAFCKHLGATSYINPIGGTELYSSDDFLRDGMELLFLKSTPPEYRQQGATHVPSLSIIDVLMFNGIEQTRHWLGCFQLVTPGPTDLPTDRTAA